MYSRTGLMVATSPDQGQGSRETLAKGSPRVPRYGVMFRRKRRAPKAEPPVAEDASTAPTQAVQPGPPAVRAILVGPKGEVRDRLATLIAAWTEIRLVGTYQSFDEATATLRDSAGRKGTAVLLDARLPPPHEARSVIRSIRERFPASRIMVYGDDLDEVAIEHHYFAGADAVLLVDATEDDIVAAIREGVLGRDDGGGPETPDADVEGAQEVPSFEVEEAPLEVETVEDDEGAEELPPEASEEPPQHEKAPRRSRERALKQTRPRGRRRGGRIRWRVKLDEAEPGEEQRQAIARNLERAVASLQPTERKTGEPEAG
jgi:DNA-binding NarL/FixJ family response regulator